MPSTLFLSHSNLLKAHYFPSKPNQPLYSNTQISSSLNPKPTNNVSKNSNSSSLTSTKQNPDPKTPLGPTKIPTPPWVQTPLVLQPHEMVDLAEPEATGGKNSGDELTDKLVNRRGKNVTLRIARSIEKLGGNAKLVVTRKGFEGIKGVEECLGSLDQLGESHRGSRDGERVPWERDGERVPWERDGGFVVRRLKKERVASTAELSLDKELLERLRAEARTMRKWVKVKKAGVTDDVVSDIRSIWKTDELVMVRFDVPLCRNMGRAQEILEMKTGGLVVRRWKDTLVIFRGCDYQPYSSRNFSKSYHRFTRLQGKPSSNLVSNQIQSSSVFGDGFDFQIDSSLYVRETDRLLDGLGPRFVDWWMNKPLPVDGDMLPEVVPGFRPPFRRCPPFTRRSQLTDHELTYLRSLAHPLPTHFVLGRNRNLQGLAAAILKLWEKCHIAKIAVKMGAQNAIHNQMAYELKRLTGGVLLLRNKFIIILYRGKDFVPPQISELISKRELELENLQICEEHARLEVAETFLVADEPQSSIGSAGTLLEFQDIQSDYLNSNKETKESKLPFEVEKERLEKELRNQERKLSILNNKIKWSTEELVKLNEGWNPSELDADREIITEEERECFRKIGLKMKGVLLLGRRGVFDGVMEGLHQHWKHREVAKVVTMQRLFWRVLYTAKMLEAESRGVLISVDKIKEGHAIIMYRGKNYRRPLKVKSGNLLTKRKALLRSLEMQRNGSLKFFAYQRQRSIAELKLKLENLQDILKVD